MLVTKVAVLRCYGRLPGFVASTAGVIKVIIITRIVFSQSSSELSEPQKLLEYLLHPGVSKLAPETIAVYVQAALKVFGFWCAEIAEHWDDDNLPRVKGVVDTMVERVTEFATNPDIEVQERVRDFQ